MDAFIEVAVAALRTLAKVLKVGEYYIADWLFLLMLLIAVLCLYRGHRNRDVDLWDVIRATGKEGKVYTDPRKLFEAGAFVVSTVGFAHMTIQGKLTEWYVMTYLGAFVTAKFLRDREQRLNRALELNAAPKEEKTP